MNGAELPIINDQVTLMKNWYLCHSCKTWCNEPVGFNFEKQFVLCRNCGYSMHVSIKDHPPGLEYPEYQRTTNIRVVTQK